MNPKPFVGIGLLATMLFISFSVFPCAFGGTRGSTPTLIQLASHQEQNAKSDRTVPDIIKGWKTVTQYELGFRSTMIVEPGDEDSASLFGEFVFQIPNEFVNLRKLSVNLLQSFKIEIKKSLPVERVKGIYQRSLVVREKGKEQLFRLELIALQEPTQQRILLLAALPEKFDSMGGRSALLNVFSDGKSLEELTHESRMRHELLQNLSDRHVIATSSTGVEMTQAHLKIGIDVAEFMAGRKLSGSDIQSLLKTIDQEWEKDPNLENFTNIKNFLKQARASDPFKRLEFAIDLYRESLKNAKQEGDESELLKIIERLNPVLAEKSGDILTQRALDARLNSAKIVMQMQGKEADEIASSIPKFRQQIVDSFAELPEFKRKSLQAAESGNFRLVTVLASLPTEARKLKLAKAKLSVESTTSVQELAHAMEEIVAQESVSKEKFFRVIEQMIYGASVLPELRNR